MVCVCCGHTSEARRGGMNGGCLLDTHTCAYVYVNENESECVDTHRVPSKSRSEESKREGDQGESHR